MALLRLLEAGDGAVASADLAARVGVNPATLRRDLSRLGLSGVRGSGYEVARLLERIDRALGLDRSWPIAIVGAGNLGRALARSRNFNEDGYRIVALFDVAPQIVGALVAGIRVDALEDLAKVCAARKVAVGIVATPAPAAQDVAVRLVEAGVRAILNFAPSVVQVPEGTALRQVDLAGELQRLTFYGTLDESRARGGAANRRE